GGWSRTSSAIGTESSKAAGTPALPPPKNATAARAAMRTPTAGVIAAVISGWNGACACWPCRMPTIRSGARSGGAMAEQAFADLGETPWPRWYDDDPRMAWVRELDPRFLAALTAPRGGYRPGPIPRPEWTLGPQWVRWVQRNVRLGEGDRFGQPPQVAPFQRALLWKLGELGEDLSRRFRFALISFGKGGGKT